MPYRQRSKILTADTIPKLEQKLQEQSDEHGGLEAISGISCLTSGEVCVVVSWLEEME